MLSDGDPEMIRVCLYQDVHSLAQDTDMPNGHQRARRGLLRGQVGQVSILEWVSPRSTPRKGHEFWSFIWEVIPRNSVKKYK